MATATRSKSQLFVVKPSKLHGLGAFATQFIKKGTRICEYLGDRISHKEADKRYEDHDPNDNHTFLFSVDRGLVIDATNTDCDAKYINHSCDPNCESVIEKRRVFVDAIRDIQKGEELTYDYQIGRERGDPPNVDEIYACLCGSPKCRGTMLWPPRRKKKKKKKVAAKRKSVRRASAKKKKTRRSQRSTARGKSKSSAARKAKRR